MGRRNTIWIIDDWQTCQTVDHLFRFSHKNCTVVPFCTESMLASHLETDHPRPAIILLGSLPGKYTQLQVMQVLKTHQATNLTPIVLLTKDADETYIRQAYEQRANACVEKPVSMDEYIQFVTLTFDYWLTCCTVPAHTAAAF